MCPHLIDPSRLRFPGNGPLNTEDNLTKLNLQYPPPKKNYAPKSPQIMHRFCTIMHWFCKIMRWLCNVCHSNDAFATLNFDDIFHKMADGGMADKSFLNIQILIRKCQIMRQNARHWKIRQKWNTESCAFLVLPVDTFDMCTFSLKYRVQQHMIQYITAHRNYIWKLHFVGF